MATTFPRFSELPKGIRDMIWDIAIRPDVPGVPRALFPDQQRPRLPVPGDLEGQYYTPETLYHSASVRDEERGCCNEDRSPVVEQIVSGQFLPGRQLHPLELGSVAGKLFRSSMGKEPSCSSLWMRSSNPSTYARDAGLWTACQESRARIRRRLGHAGSSFIMRDEPEAAPRYFGIQAERDLVIIQPQIYDPSLAARDYAKQIWKLGARGVDKVWFIDYSMHRLDWVPDARCTLREDMMKHLYARSEAIRRCVTANESDSLPLSASSAVISNGDGGDTDAKGAEDGEYVPPLTFYAPDGRMRFVEVRPFTHPRFGHVCNDQCTNACPHNSAGIPLFPANAFGLDVSQAMERVLASLRSIRPGADNSWVPNVGVLACEVVD
ncbi:Uu.00g114540.m01.CDS01 [Anthostomella pinea]|uniref:Uu.00g114540.m01.CDS01 n=1 Tax=Anthostomella pinea TaxID=933095 RepID=A0AAI8VGL9_9PEZI|nr:Uu.00g114540.m01.CDS01 [Anthostomella pinea]